MIDLILTSRLFVPIMFIIYGFYLFCLRHLTLDCVDANVDILLVFTILVGAILTWAIDIGCGDS